MLRNANGISLSADYYLKSSISYSSCIELNYVQQLVHVIMN